MENRHECRSRLHSFNGSKEVSDNEDVNTGEVMEDVMSDGSGSEIIILMRLPHWMYQAELDKILKNDPDSAPGHRASQGRGGSAQQQGRGGGEQGQMKAAQKLAPTRRTQPWLRSMPSGRGRLKGQQARRLASRPRQRRWPRRLKSRRQSCQESSTERDAQAMRRQTRRRSCSDSQANAAQMAEQAAAAVA